jgi:hypothetical protein
MRLYEDTDYHIEKLNIKGEKNIQIQKTEVGMLEFILWS